MGLPLFQSSDSEMLHNIFKEKVNQLEDKVYYTEQNLYNCMNIQKQFLKLADLMKINISSIHENELNDRKEQKKTEESANSEIDEIAIPIKQKVYDLKFWFEKFKTQNQKNGQNLFGKKLESQNAQSKKTNVSLKLTNSFTSETKNTRMPIFKNKTFQNKIQLNKFFSELKQNDLIYQLSKIKHIENQFSVFNFLNKQHELNLHEINLHYTVQENNLFLQKSDEFLIEKKSEDNGEHIKEKIIDLNFIEESKRNSKINPNRKQKLKIIEELNGSSDSIDFYKMIRNNLSLANDEIEFNAEIILDKVQKSVVLDYIDTNLQILNRRIRDLSQLIEYKNKQKNRITRNAMNFFYDQKTVNQLNNNLSKIKERQIDNLFMILEIRNNQDTESATDSEIEFKCLEYNLSSPFCLKIVTNRNAEALAQNLK